VYVLAERLAVLHKCKNVLSFRDDLVVDVEVEVVVENPHPFEHERKEVVRDELDGLEGVGLMLDVLNKPFTAR
jgi:hypothetical protein